MRMVTKRLLLLFTLALLAQGWRKQRLLDRPRAGRRRHIHGVRGVGLGAQGRVGPLHLGLLSNLDRTGLRAAISPSTGDPRSQRVVRRRLAHLADPSELGEGFCFGMEMFVRDGIPKGRLKGYAAVSRIPFVSWIPKEYSAGSVRQSLPYYTRVEVVAAPLLSLRLGSIRANSLISCLDGGLGHLRGRRRPRRQARAPVKTAPKEETAPQEKKDQTIESGGNPDAEKSIQFRKRPSPKAQPQRPQRKPRVPPAKTRVPRPSKNHR